MHQFIDKMESNSLWIKWMKVRWLCPGPGSGTRCSPHAAAKVWVSHLRQKGAHHIISYFFNGLVNSRLLKVFSRHHTFVFQDIIELQIEYKKRRPSQLYSDLNHDVIAFTVDGYLVREFWNLNISPNRIEFQSKASLRLTIVNIFSKF